MKAILVIDIPDETISGWVVENLQINKYNTDINSPAFGGFVDGIEYHLGELILKPLPNKISHSEIDNPSDDNFEDEHDYWEIEGYNACIDEILEEGSKRG